MIQFLIAVRDKRCELGYNILAVMGKKVDLERIP